MCFLQQREAWFCKNVNRKVSSSIKNMKDWPCNLKFWCKVASMATKFTKMQVCCMQSFLLTVTWRRKVHGTREGDMKRTNSEPNEQWSDKGEQKWQTRLLWRPFGGQKSDFFNEKCSKSVSKIMLPTAARNTFLKKRKTKRMWMTSETKIVLDPTVSPPISPLVRPERVHKQEILIFPMVFACRANPRIIANHRESQLDNSIFYQSVNPFD